MKKDSKIYIAGAEGFYGSAVLRQLKEQGYMNLFGAEKGTPVLTDTAAISAFFSKVKPEYVFLTGGKSGGIQANLDYPAELIHENLQIALNIIPNAYLHKVKKLLYLGSSCCYPRLCPQPIREDYLLTGALEPTNEAYAAAKIAGIKMCEAYRKQYKAPFISVIPPNIFGPEDDFHPDNSHVMAALIRKIDEAKKAGEKSVEIWGTGKPRREFLYVDDLADACIFLMREYDGIEHINAGGGSDLSIRELAEQIKQAVGYKGELRFNASKPDGMPVKLLDSAKLLAMGWTPKTKFSDALAKTYEWYIQNLAK